MTASKLVPLEQVSSGTMDQIYLALRLGAARLIQNEAKEQMPLVFDSREDILAALSPLFSEITLDLRPRVPVG